MISRVMPAISAARRDRAAGRRVEPVPAARCVGRLGLRRIGDQERCCSASSFMPVPAAKSSGDWVQPCSITTSGSGCAVVATRECTACRTGAGRIGVHAVLEARPVRHHAGGAAPSGARRGRRVSPTPGARDRLRSPRNASAQGLGHLRRIDPARPNAPTAALPSCRIPRRTQSAVQASPVFGDGGCMSSLLRELSAEGVGAAASRAEPEGDRRVAGGAAPQQQCHRFVKATGAGEAGRLGHVLGNRVHLFLPQIETWFAGVTPGCCESLGGVIMDPVRQARPLPQGLACSAPSTWMRGDGVARELRRTRRRQ
jgi:hypothetical protein